MNTTRTLQTLALITCTTTTLAVFFACSDPERRDTTNTEDNTSETTLERRAILENLGENIIIPAYNDFAQNAALLEEATASYAANPNDTSLQTARNAWVKTIDSWQLAEVFQIGPAGVMDEVIAGQDLRDNIYSWPTTNPCRVDQETINNDFADPTTFASEFVQKPVNTRGLDALEYLLFTNGEDNACSPNSSINSQGTWTTFSLEERQQRRARYAHTLSILIHQHAKSLQDAWDPNGGNFLAELTQAGLSSSTYPTTQDAFNAISDAMFYAEKQTKDMKLAKPAGILECPTETCPDALESPFAQRSRDHALNNLRAFQLLYLGGDPTTDPDALGFDDLLRANSADDLDTQLTSKIQASIDSIQSNPTPFHTLVQQDPDSLVSIHNTTADAMTLFKTQFVSVLNLELPKSVETDND